MLSQGVELFAIGPPLTHYEGTQGHVKHLAPAASLRRNFWTKLNHVRKEDGPLVDVRTSAIFKVGGGGGDVG